MFNSLRTKDVLGGGLTPTAVLIVLLGVAQNRERGAGIESELNNVIVAKVSVVEGNMLGCVHVRKRASPLNILHWFVVVAFVLSLKLYYLPTHFLTHPIRKAGAH